jgi:hypothetical protein
VFVSDPMTFICREGKNVAIVAWFVDDAMSATNNHEFLLTKVVIWKKHFTLKTDFNPKDFLGMKVQHQVEQQVLRLDQSNNVKKLINTLGLDNAKPAKTPQEVSHSDEWLITNTDELNVARRPYQVACGQLIWLLNCRYDIAFATLARCRKMGKSNADDDIKMKRVARYLIANPDRPLTFRASKVGVVLFGVVDAAFLNQENSRSTTGWAAFIGDPESRGQGGGAAVMVKSTIQKLVSHSSFESESHAACEMLKAIEWIRLFLLEAGFPQEGPTRVYSDNQAVIQVSVNPILHARTRHFRMRLDYIQDLVRRRVVEFNYVPTGENCADTLTKALPKESFEKHSSSLMGSP